MTPENHNKNIEELVATIQLLKDPAVASAEAEVQAMTPAQRRRAMWAGELSLTQLAWWSRRHPGQVPKVHGEFAWITMTTPEYCERER